jgi:DNA repair photolyase
MDNRIKWISEILEEAHSVSKSLDPVISGLENSQDAKEIAFAIEEIDLKFDELDGLYDQAMRLCKNLFLENISRVGWDAMERVLQEDEEDGLTRKRLSVILRDIKA